MTDKRRWLVLGVVLMGTFMAVLDVAIVNVAIPSIRADLGATFGEIEFVVSAYTLTYACLLVTGGRLGDNYGRKRLFILGLAAFAAASAACGMAPTSDILIASRAVQGIGGALMYPQVLAIIQVNFVDQERAKALGIFGSVIGIAAVAGQILGGALIALDIWHLEWRPIFLVNVPLALATIVAADLHPAERRAHRNRRSRLGRRRAGHHGAAPAHRAAARRPRTGLAAVDDRLSSSPPFRCSALLSGTSAASRVRGGRPLVRMEPVRLQELRVTACRSRVCSWRPMPATCSPSRFIFRSGSASRRCNRE